MTSLRIDVPPYILAGEPSTLELTAASAGELAAWTDGAAPLTVSTEPATVEDWHRSKLAGPRVADVLSHVLLNRAERAHFPVGAPQPARVEEVTRGQASAVRVTVVVESPGKGLVLVLRSSSNAVVRSLPFDACRARLTPQPLSPTDPTDLMRGPLVFRGDDGSYLWYNQMGRKSEGIVVRVQGLEPKMTLATSLHFEDGTERDELLLGITPQHAFSASGEYVFRLRDVSRNHGNQRFVLVVAADGVVPAVFPPVRVEAKRRESRSRWAGSRAGAASSSGPRRSSSGHNGSRNGNGNGNGGGRSKGGGDANGSDSDQGDDDDDDGSASSSDPSSGSMSFPSSGATSGTTSAASHNASSATPILAHASSSSSNSHSHHSSGHPHATALGGNGHTLAKDPVAKRRAVDRAGVGRPSSPAAGGAPNHAHSSSSLASTRQDTLDDLVSSQAEIARADAELVADLARLSDPVDRRRRLVDEIRATERLMEQVSNSFTYLEQRRARLDGELRMAVQREIWAASDPVIQMATSMRLPSAPLGMAAATGGFVPIAGGVAGVAGVAAPFGGMVGQPAGASSPGAALAMGLSGVPGVAGVPGAMTMGAQVQVPVTMPGGVLPKMGNGMMPPGALAVASTTFAAVSPPQQMKQLQGVVMNVDAAQGVGNGVGLGLGAPGSAAAAGAGAGGGSGVTPAALGAVFSLKSMRGGAAGS